MKKYIYIWMEYQLNLYIIHTFKKHQFKQLK